MAQTMEKTCHRCKATFAFPVAEGTFLCPFCGAVNGLPQGRGAAWECLARANRQRLANDFHNAVNSYQHVLLDSQDEHEALWGLALCRYGVEYVNDTITGRLMPTVHSVRRKPMQLDGDFMAALECAPPEVAAQYEADAQYVDKVMSRIVELADTCPPFDVFLCHKTTKSGSKDKTDDYSRAFKLYHNLTMNGYRVFFAPEEMQGVAAGADYEAAIYHALETSKVMLLICSDPDYLTSAWVRSEWSRFLEMSDEEQGKCLVPLMYGNFGAAGLPREIRVRKLQGVSMEDWDAQSTIMNVLEKKCGKVKPVQKPVQEPEQPRRQQPKQPVSKPRSESVTYTPEKFFEVEPFEDGCRIRKYTGSTGPDQDLYIPPVIQGMPVREISSVFTTTIEDNQLAFRKFNVVYIPETLSEKVNFRPAECREFRTAEGSVFSTQDGVLFCNDTLVRYPVLRKEKAYAVPDKTEVLQAGAFMGAEMLEEIQLPEGLEKVEEYAFTGCKNLKALTLPHTITELSETAFESCGQVRLRIYRHSSAQRAIENGGLCIYEELDETGSVVGFKGVYTPEEYFEVEPHEDGCKITGFTGSDGGTQSLYIPPTIRGMKVLDIKAEAFVPAEKSLRFFQSVYLPETLKNVNGQSLDGLYCYEFRTSGDPEALFSARDGVLFFDEDVLIRYPMAKKGDSYTVPEGTRVIFNSAFDSAHLLKEIKLPEGLEEIWANAFWMCGSLENLTLPNSLTELGEQAFHGCIRLKLRVYRDSYAHTAVREQGLTYEVLDGAGRPERASIRYTPEGEFRTEPYEDGCKITGYTGKSNDLFIPPTIAGKKVRMIGSYAFVANGEVGNLYKPERAFGIVYLPDTLQDVAGTSWQGISVGEFRVDESNPYMEAREGVLFYKTDCTLLAYPQDNPAQSYTVPAGTRRIFHMAFCYCENLREIILPDSVREIGGNAFSDCTKLQKIILPEGLEKLGGLAFSYCPALTSLTIPRSVTDIHERAFEDCSSLTLRVCKGSQAHARVRSETVNVAYELLSPTGQTLEPATLVFRRKAKFVGALRRDAIRIDGKQTQTLASGGKVTFKVTPGVHLLEIADQMTVMGATLGEVNWEKGESVLLAELQPGEVKEFEMSDRYTLFG